ncbi:linear amide C-N hydrolase [Thalassospira sp. MCCC 1A03138]|uniref:linear amide C-N hydrolase n=1 Tax=Thalassospira sp. MCCC 1A03138 TaxID=1470576 RepID=UPI00143D50D8|nr:linear amide C-N hydrolase [Thalassospira sp. MCCC 1A03138]
MCTDFQICVDQQGYVSGRSMEFALNLNSKFFFRRVGHKYTQDLWGKNFGYSWTGKYGFVAMNCFDQQIVTDGMNTAGLSTGNLWLPGSKYQTITDPQRGLCIDNFAAWILSSFATCDEVKQALKDETVQVGASTLVTGLLPLHFPIHDGDGNCIVIEFTDGKAIVYDNPVGVLTNQPEFPWHLDNLRNYTSLSPYDADEATFNGHTFTQTGHGSGLSDLPGDPTPPSRFVRATVMTSFAAPVTSLDAGTNLAFHILNTVDIPKGLVAGKKDNKSILPDMDYTQWVVVRDAARKIYSVRFYGSQQVRSINLTELEQSGQLDELDGLLVPFTSNGFGNMTREELGATEPPKSVADLPRNN